ncbi:glycosyl hydrolase [Psychromonas sp.]|uniref:glycosyl hydrolase n=1 Tax=Psychromonas sp. TaxID=1884585 RepID=UPI0039E5131C
MKAIVLSTTLAWLPLSGCGGSDTIQVEQNNAPVLNGTPLANAQDGSEYQYQLSISDADGDAITFSATTKPAWLNLSAGGLLSGTPSTENIGNENISLTYSDGTVTKTHTFTITVSAASITNVAPVLNGQAISIARVDSVYRYQLNVSDANNDPITFSATTKPAWLNFSASGLLSGTPSSQNIGNENISLTYSDGTVTKTHTFTLVVSAAPIGVNVAPVLNGTALSNAQINSEYSYQLNVTDSNNDAITYNAVTIPSWLSFSASGLLSGTPSNDNIGDANIALTYSDGEFTEALNFTLVVADGYFVEPPVAAVRTTVNAADPSTYNIISYGAGSISDGINPAGYGCSEDYGYWVHGAGVVEPAIAGCDNGTVIGEPTYLHPQVIGEIASQPTPTHKWWGSISFLGEMEVGNPNNAAYITPDPIYARISNKGVRILGLPNGLAAYEPTGFSRYGYNIPDPFSEVFDGIAVANSEFTELQAYLKDYSDGSVTVQWQSGNQPVMEATFVHGSPYVYFKAFRGELVIKTLRADGGEKGTFYSKDNNLGVWTSVGGNRHDFIISGEGATTFANSSSNAITVSNAANELTVSYLPANNGVLPTTETADFFAQTARNVVRKVDINYAVDRSDNSVSVSHDYLDKDGIAIETIAGLQPMHWKNSSDAILSAYKVRSARGMVKFSKTAQYSYEMPFVGVLPSLPSNVDNFDLATLQDLITEYAAKGASKWNVNDSGETNNDTYWSGKSYGKMAEIIAIARSIGMDNEADLFTNWLKTELADWFSADTNGSLDTEKYFVYDKEWNTLLGMQESFLSHQQLNDHHFHYGYFVRAAAEICRTDPTWCSDEQYGPMIELLIRDYASSKNDTMFPYLRNFDPANGFSWASGVANFANGNNNESTSEAANSYGAIVLYGMITGNDQLVEKGMYLHASSTTAYWEYWNNIDRFRNQSDAYPNRGDDYDNFPTAYPRITTSIIWGNGHVFSTWFSGAYAHILGIQGLPLNPLVLHVGQYADYMQEYVALGLTESSNGKPSGLADDQWRDIWWGLWAMTDADAAMSDYVTMPDYQPENGETKAHTYHWLHTWQALGHLKTGTGTLTADYPAAVAFEKEGKTTYIIYNYGSLAKEITFSDGTKVDAAPAGFTVKTVE